MTFEISPALMDAIQTLYPEECAQLKALENPDEIALMLLQLMNRMAEEGHINPDPFAIFKRLSQKQFGVLTSESHTAGAATSIQQSAKGTLRWSKDKVKRELNEIIERLREQKPHSDETAEELWPRLLGDLDAAWLNPTEHENEDSRKRRIEYGPDDGRTNITFGTFENRLKNESR